MFKPNIFWEFAYVGFGVHLQEVFTKWDIHFDEAVEGLSWAGSQRLGAGSFGEVHKVTFHHCPVAVKIQEASELANDEVKHLINAGSHPNILP